MEQEAKQAIQILEELKEQCIRYYFGMEAQKKRVLEKIDGTLRKNEWNGLLTDIEKSRNEYLNRILYLERLKKEIGQSGDITDSVVKGLKQMLRKVEDNLYESELMRMDGR